MITSTQESVGKPLWLVRTVPACEKRQKALNSIHLKVHTPIKNDMSLRNEKSKEVKIKKIKRNELESICLQQKKISPFPLNLLLQASEEDRLRFI